MTELIGTLDDRTLHAELELKSLEPLARAYWSMTAYSVHPRDFPTRFGEESGTVQVFFPGPVAKYQKGDGYFAVQILHNGGNPKMSEELHRQLLPYAKNDTR